MGALEALRIKLDKPVFPTPFAYPMSSVRHSGKGGAIEWTDEMENQTNGDTA